MKILALDIETAPNVVHVWGLWNQNVGINQIVASGYTLCWSAKWLGSSKVLFSSSHRTRHREMIKEVWGLLNEADVVLHYNGTKFDIPTLNKEFVQYNLPPPNPYLQIDLYKVVRRAFKFPSNKLDYVCQALGLGGKTRHLGHEMWVGCMNRDQRSWDVMEKYNKQDVQLLDKLYRRILPWIHNHPNHALYDPVAAPTCRNCGSTKVKKNGYEYTSTQRYQRYRCTKCGANLRGRTTTLPRNSKSNILV